MSKILGYCLFLVLVFGVYSEATAERYGRNSKVKSKVTGCSTVYAIGRNIYKNSKPHRACSAINCPIDYFERFPSLLINQSGLPRPSSATLIDSNGASVMTCGKLDCRDCSAGYRYVCRGNTNSIAKTLKKRTGNYTAYYKIGTKCVTIADIGKCVGSVKGLCNQTLH